MSLILDRVSSGDSLLACWPRVREGLVANTRFHGEVAAPERMYQAVVAGTAHLFLLADDSDAEFFGFAILTVEGVGIRLDPYLYLWQLWAPGLHKYDRMDQFTAALDGLACERGLTRIRMNTTRKGWARAVARYASPVLVEYERSVPHG